MRSLPHQPVAAVCTPVTAVLPVPTPVIVHPQLPPQPLGAVCHRVTGKAEIGGVMGGQKWVKEQLCAGVQDGDCGAQGGGPPHGHRGGVRAAGQRGIGAQVCRHLLALGLGEHLAGWGRECVGGTGHGYSTGPTHTHAIHTQPQWTHALALANCTRLIMQCCSIYIYYASLFKISIA